MKETVLDIDIKAFLIYLRSHIDKCLEMQEKLEAWNENKLSNEGYSDKELDDMDKLDELDNYSLMTKMKDE